MRDLVLGVVIGCVACATPYQTKGFRGGYSEVRAGDRWIVSVEVNSFTSRSTAIVYAYRRAAELCPAGFDERGADVASRDFYVRTGNVVQNAPKSSASLVVSCRSPVAPTPAVAERPQHWVEDGIHVIATDHRFSCFDASPTIRVCASDRTTCDRFRSVMNSGSPDCAESNAMACYRSRDRVTAQVAAMCFATLATCRVGRTEMVLEDHALTDEDCFVMRYRP